MDEELAFPLSGEGEHVYLRIEKRGENTDRVCRLLAALAGVSRGAVGVAGLKDRRAVTRQWFSVHLPSGPEPGWSRLEGDSIRLLEVTRHRTKLRRGVARGNRFGIVLRELEGSREALEERLRRLVREGLPNYFGEQRFGRGGNNLRQALAMFEGRLRTGDRHLRGLYLSAARSWLFNRILAARIRGGSWNQPLAGDLMLFDGSSRSYFLAEEVDEGLLGRVGSGAVHPSGALWGRGRHQTRGAVQALEARIAGSCPALIGGLESSGVKMGRRALRAKATGLVWNFGPGRVLELSFFLPSGAYATSLLRELVRVESGPGQVPGIGL